MIRSARPRLENRWSRRQFIAVALTAAGRFGAPKPRTVAAAIPASQVKTLRFALSAADRVRLLPLLQDYERETGVSVIPVTFGNLYRALSVELTRGICSFDVVSIDDPWVAVFAGGRFLHSLDELGDASQRPLNLSNFVPSFLSLGLAPGSTELFALPWIGNVQLYGYDDQVFHTQQLDPPRTWRAAVAAATTITRDHAPNTYGFGLRGRPATAATTFLPFLRGFGVELLNVDGQPQLATDGASRAMATLLELAALGPRAVVETGHDELAVQLETGQVAQSVDLWPTQLLGWKEAGMGEPMRHVRVSHTPCEPGVVASPVTGNWLLGIPTACGATAPAAFEFIRWLTDAPQQLRLLLEAGLPPTRAAILSDEEALRRHPLLPGLAELAAIAKPRPRTPYYPAIEQVVGDWVSAALAGEVSGDQALSQANMELEAVIRPPVRGPF